MSSTHAMQMALFSVPEPEPPKPEPPQPVEWGETLTVDPGPVGCVSTVGGGRRCKKPGVYLKGGFVLCEKHMQGSVWSEMSATKESRERHPHVLYCADGFNTVRWMGREDHQARGEHRRVQVCRSDKCKAVFAVHWLWTGEALLCPSCRNAALREILGQTQAIPQHSP
jgi:hypothetical protein